MLLYAGVFNAWAADLDFDALVRKAESGDGQAQFDLWQAYMERGETREAYKWLDQAVVSEHPKALLYMASVNLMYEEPDKVAEGVYQLEVAAGQDDPEALNYLGGFYYTGQYVPQDYQRTLELWIRAGLLGNGESAYRVGSMYAYGADFGMLDTADYDLAVLWFEKAYAVGYYEAAFHLGHLYLLGKGVTQDFALACQWLEQAAEHGVMDAAYALGMMYYNAEGVAQDYGKALAYFNSLAESAQPEAMYMLGLMYAGGHGTVQDYPMALKCHESAAAQGYGPAQLALAEMLVKGQGRDAADLSGAYSWYTLAAANDVARAAELTLDIERQMPSEELAEAQFKLARFYFFGYGGQSNHILAYMHLLTAKALGLPVDDMLGTLGGLTPEEIVKATQLSQAWLAERGY